MAECTSCGEDLDLPEHVHDGDEVRCDECGASNAISVDEDGDTWTQEADGGESNATTETRGED